MGYCSDSLGGRRWPWLRALGAIGTFDWFLTWLLVGNGNAAEANPIAAQVLHQFGWLGLAFFKVATVGLVAILVQIIARKNKVAARRLVQFACACTFVIVGYSFFQMVRQEIDSAGVLHREERRCARILEKRQNFQKYITKVDELSRQLIEENRHLSHAVQDLVLFMADLNLPNEKLAFFGEAPNLEERLATHLISHAGYLLNNQPAAAMRLLARLQGEFASAFSFSPLPGRALEWYPRQDKDAYLANDLPAS